MQTIEFKEVFNLENGAQLDSFQLAYHSRGTLNEKADNVVWVCHALTGNSDVFDWWSGLFEGDSALNDPNLFIICVNVLGSHYGSTGPLSFSKQLDRPYFHDFPEITISDIVNAHRKLATHLGIKKISLLIGGSLGGQQCFDWAVRFPEEIEKTALIATNSEHSAWGKAFNESQRQAIYLDPSFVENSEGAGKKGMEVARGLALLSYRNFETYLQNDLLQKENKTGQTPQSYQIYQGKKLAERFNAFSYVLLSKAMDSHLVSKGFSSITEALNRIEADVLLIGVDSDILFPSSHLKGLTDSIKHARFEEISSVYGHDGFLIETKKIKTLLNEFISCQKKLISDYSALDA